MARIDNIRKSYFDEGNTIGAIAAKLGIVRLHPHGNILGDVAKLHHFPAGLQGLRAHSSIPSSKAVISSGRGSCPFSSLGRVLVIS